MHKREKSKVSKLITTIVVVVLLVNFVIIFADQQRILSAKNKEAKTMQAKIDEEKKLKDDLTKKKEMINSNEYIEKVAREKLGMVKHGEKVFVDVNK